MTRSVSSILLLSAAMLSLSGCIASTALDVVTAPVKGVAKVADWATTSQDEADRNRGRELRRLEERYARLAREYDEAREDCRDGEEDACDDARTIWAEMEEIRPQIPAPPEE